MNKNNSDSGDETRLFTPLKIENNRDESRKGTAQPRSDRQGQTRPNGSAQPRPNGQGQTRPNGSAQLRPDRQAQIRPNGSAQPRADGQGQTRPNGSAQPRTDGQGQTRPNGSAQPRADGQAQIRPNNQGQNRSAGQYNLRTPEQVQRKSAGQDRFDGSQTRIIRTVKPEAQNGLPRNSGNTDRIKSIYKKDGTSQNPSVNHTAGPDSGRIPADRGSQTRVMNAVVPGAGGNVRAPVQYRGKKRKNASVRPLSVRNGNEDGGEAVTGALTSVMKAIIYIVFVLVVSGFLSYFGISVCNDIFAFVKPDNETVITVPEFATLNDIADILSENDIISYPSVFKLYAKLRRDSGEYLAGVYTVTPSMNYDMLLSDFKPQIKPRAEVSITIPEGYSIDQIIEIFVSNGMGTREGFKEVIENGDFSEYNVNWFIKEIDANKSPDRKYRLEGYLFPDTYYFYSDSDEYTVIYKLLKNFYNKFDEAYTARCEELGYTVDQIITLASMIQAEAKFASEYSTVSSVFHNRLNNPSGPTQGRLESDPTIQYMLEEHKAMLDKSDTEIDHPYNTYIIKGLPPGPICNPGLNAIQYALYPAETEYLYFVAQTNGYHLFAATYDEHIMNIIAARGG